MRIFIVKIILPLSWKFLYQERLSYIKIRSWLFTGGVKNAAFDDLSMGASWGVHRSSSLDTNIDIPEDEVSYGAPQPDDFLSYNVAVCTLCCPPLGVVAIRHSMECREALRKDEQTLASKSSRKAKLWCYFTLMCGIFFYIMSGFLAAIFVVAYADIY